MSNILGNKFEDFLRRRILRTAQIQASVGSGDNTVDFLDQGVYIEAKTGRTIAGRELEQLRAIAEEAVSEGLEFIYLFLYRPTPGTRQKVHQAGGQALWFFTAPGTR